MRANRCTMLAAGIVLCAAVMTGCAAMTTPEATSAPQAVQRQTASPEAEQTPSMETETSEAVRMLPLFADGKEADADAAYENGKLLLPLEATGRALGWKTNSHITEGETQNRCEITLDKDESRITVTYETSDNTIRRISWQKDGLLIPVDTRIETFEGIVYVPAAFFEEATGVKVSEGENKVELSSPEPIDTPQTNQ